MHINCQCFCYLKSINRIYTLSCYITLNVLQIAVEFCKVLLHLEDIGTIPGFIIHRHAAIVSLAVTSPIEVSYVVLEKVRGQRLCFKQTHEFCHNFLFKICNYL